VTKAAAVLAWVAGFGFGLPGAYGAAYLARNAEVWTFLGLPTLPMQMAFVLVCVAELITGNLLWVGHPAGRTMSLALLPFEAFFWFGFALPFGFVLGAARAGLTVVRPTPA